MTTQQQLVYAVEVGQDHDESEILGIYATLASAKRRGESGANFGYPWSRSSHNTWCSGSGPLWVAITRMKLEP